MKARDRKGSPVSTNLSYEGVLRAFEKHREMLGVVAGHEAQKCRLLQARELILSSIKDCDIEHWKTEKFFVWSKIIEEFDYEQGTIKYGKQLFCDNRVPGTVIINAWASDLELNERKVIDLIRFGVYPNELDRYAMLVYHRTASSIRLRKELFKKTPRKFD